MLAWEAALRDHNGKVVCSASDSHVLHCQTAAMGDALECLHELEMTLPIYSTNLIDETNLPLLLKPSRSTGWTALRLVLL